MSQGTGTPGQQAPNLQIDDKFKLEYEVVNNYILHYSNIRSALASFLVTVALASFAGYYSVQDNSNVSQESFLAVEHGPHILWVAGYLFLIAAIVASLFFSYMTERTTEYSTRLWNWGVNGQGAYPGGFRGSWRDVSGQPLPNSQRSRIVWKRVEKDLMNWLLIVGAVAIGIAFHLFEIDF